MSKGAVVLLSGGLDSTVCLFHTLDSGEFDEVHALSFEYGQRHEQIEVRCAENMAGAAGVRHEIHGGLRFPVWSALTHGGTLDAKTSRNPSLPASFVPGRNLVLVTLAAQYGYDHGLDTVVIGANQVDFSGYPDCREHALDAMQTAVHECFDWEDFVVSAPLINYSKAEIWGRAQALGILDLVTLGTFSCYKGETGHVHPWGRGCGECPSCEIRAGGWYEFQKVVRSGMDLGGLG